MAPFRFIATALFAPLPLYSLLNYLTTMKAKLVVVALQTLLDENRFTSVIVVGAPAPARQRPKPRATDAVALVTVTISPAAAAAAAAVTFVVAVAAAIAC